MCVATAILALLDAGGTVEGVALVFWHVCCLALEAILGTGGTVGACGARLLTCALPCAGGDLGAGGTVGACSARFLGQYVWFVRGRVWPISDPR